MAMKHSFKHFLLDVEGQRTTWELVLCPILPPCGSWDWTWVDRCGRKLLYLLTVSVGHSSAVLSMFLQSGVPHILTGLFCYLILFYFHWKTLFSILINRTSGDEAPHCDFRALLHSFEGHYTVFFPRIFNTTLSYESPPRACSIRGGSSTSGQWV